MKKETLEEAAENYIENTMKFSFNSLETKTQANRMLKCVEFGAKWQAERMYSEENLKNLTELFLSYYFKSDKDFNDCFNEWFEQFKKK